MKYLIIILLSIIFASCNPFISKELRRKNKCNDKFENESKRHKKKVAKIAVNCPEIITEQIAVKVYDTTIITMGARVDTLVSFDFDTITLYKDKLRLKLIKTRDTLIVNGECIPDTIRIIERIEIPYEQNSKIELNNWEKLMNGAKDFWWLAVVFVILLFVIRIAWRFFFTK